MPAKKIQKTPLLPMLHKYKVGVVTEKKKPGEKMDERRENERCPPLDNIRVHTINTKPIYS